MKSFLLLVLLVFAGALQAAEPSPVEFELTAPGDLEIGPDGAVRSWKMDSHKLGRPIEDLLRKNIAQWRFEPVLVDGRPVIAKTRMSVTLTAITHGDGYLLKVSDVSFGSAKPLGDIVPPRYPVDAIRAGLGARVLLSIKLDAQGNVVAAHPYQTSLSKHGNESQAERWRKRFEQVSLKAVRQWKYELGQELDGNAVGSTLMVPITFTITPGRTSKGVENRWHRYVPGPITPAPWTDAKSVAQLDLDGLDDGESASLDSPFKLSSDVVGKAL